MKSLYDLKLDFLGFIAREREEQQKQLELFSSGTLTVRRNGVDITPKTVEQIKDAIARLDALTAKLEKELHG